MTKKEQFFSVMRGENPPKWMGYGFNAWPQCMFHCVIDPITVWDILFISGENVMDHWGVVHRFLPGDPGIIPMVNEQNQVIKDITHWRDYVTRPPIKMPDSAWEMTYAMAEKIDRDQVFLSGMVFPGLFEQTHHHCEIQRALIYLYEEPDDVKDLIKFFRDW